MEGRVGQEGGGQGRKEQDRAGKGREGEYSKGACYIAVAGCVNACVL